MAGDWIPIFILPNVQLRCPIEGEIAALTPANDPRVVALSHAHPKLGRFLDRFTDNFGENVEPAVLLRRADTPPRFQEIETLTSFRNLIAISVVPYNQAWELQQPHRGRILFGETFALYPWMLDTRYEGLIGNTPALSGANEFAKFKGQSSPSVSCMSLAPGDIDRPLLTALLKRWRCCYEAAEPDRTDIALFRSVNMAYHASLLPAPTENIFYDIGRLVSLWVSAFEILAHPGKGQVTPKRVFDLIEKRCWKLPEMAEWIYDTGGEKKVKRPLASWLYQALYDCRNNFLHGNPVEPDNLQLPGSTRKLIQFAAPLYRLALTAFLPLTFDRDMPAASDTEACGTYIGDCIEFCAPQRCVEKAILTARGAGKRADGDRTP